MRYFKYPEVVVSLAGTATEAKQDAQIVLETDMAASLNAIEAIDFATEAKQDAQIVLETAIDASLNTIKAIDFATEAKQDSIISELQAISANTGLTVVDQIDTTPVLDISGSNIPASSANSLQVVASLAANVKKVITVEDIGEFIGLYSGAVATPTLLCVLPLGGGEVEVEIPAATLVSIRHMKNTAITSGFLSINFLG